MHIYIYLFLYRLHIMSGSCKHQKRCGLSWLRLLYIFLNKIYYKKKKIIINKIKRKHHILSTKSRHTLGEPSPPSLSSMLLLTEHHTHTHHTHMVYMHKMSITHTILHNTPRK